MSKEDNLQLISDCEDRESRLTDWERGFIADIAVVIEKGHTLTDKQIEKLGTIWDRVTEDG